MHFDRLRRRDIVTLLGGAAAWPVAARAQQTQHMRRISVLTSYVESEPEATAIREALERGLLKFGWGRNRNLIVDYRFGLIEPEQVRKTVGEVIALTPDVILAHTPATSLALQRATRTIPIVFVQASDPVNLGLVRNLAKPEGNVTGFVLFEPSLGGKWLQLLRDVAPNVREVLVMQAADNPSSSGYMQSIESAAPLLGATIGSASVRDPDDIVWAIDAFGGRPNVGMIVLPGPIFSAIGRQALIATPLARGLPSIYPFKRLALEGGLLSYSADNIDQWRQAASYVDRILRGAQPTDLPIQLPTKFELIINLKTANALGLTIHRDVLLIADEIIE